MNWQGYVSKHAGTQTNREISSRVGVTEATISRWKNGSIRTPDAAQVADFARAYNRPVLEAFIAARFLTPDEARQRPAAAPNPWLISNEELLSLVRERMNAAETTDPILRAARVAPLESPHTGGQAAAGEENQDPGSDDPA